MNGGFLEVLMASLVPQKGCRMQVMVKQRVFGVPETNRGDGAGSGGALRVQVAPPVVPELRCVVQGWAEQSNPPSSTDTSTMMWQRRWTRKAMSWAWGARRGSGEQAGGDWEVWLGSRIIVDDGGAGRVRLSSRRRVQMNTSALLCVTAFLGL